MSSLRFLIDVNVGLAVAHSLQQSGHDVTFAGDVDWRMTDADMLSLAHGGGGLSLPWILILAS